MGIEMDRARSLGYVRKTEDTREGWKSQKMVIPFSTLSFLRHHLSLTNDDDKRSVMDFREGLGCREASIEHRRTVAKGFLPPRPFPRTPLRYVCYTSRETTLTSSAGNDGLKRPFFEEDKEGVMK